MEKVKQFFKKYAMYIIIALFALLFIKSCQSCSRSNTIEFQKVEMDSLKQTIMCKSDTIRFLNDSIVRYKERLDGCQVRINDLNERQIELKESNSFLQESNSSLQKSNSTLQKSNNTLTNTNREIIINKNKTE